MVIELSPNFLVWPSEWWILPHIHLPACGAPLISSIPAWDFCSFLCRLAMGMEGLQPGPGDLLPWPFYSLSTWLSPHFPPKSNSSPTSPQGDLPSSWVANNCPFSVVLVSVSSLLVCSGSYLDHHPFCFFNQSVHSLMTGPRLMLVCLSHRALHGTSVTTRW